jgi:hypothetical protein
LLQFAIEEFAYFGNQFKCRRSHVSPRRMDADGPVVASGLSRRARLSTS